MSTPIYAWPADNLGPSATISVESPATEDTSFPKENLTDLDDLNLENPAGLNETSGAFILDHGSAVTIKAVALWHNLAAGVRVHVQRNATNSGWTTPSVDITITAPAKRADGYTYKLLAQPTGSYRYTRIWVEDTNDVNVKMKAWLSDVRTLARDPIAAGFTPTELHNSIVLTTDADAFWTYDISGSRAWRFTIAAYSAVVAALQELFRATGGPTKPFFFAITSASSTYGPFLCRLSEPMQGQSTLVYSSLDFPMEEPEDTRVELKLLELCSGEPEWT